VVGLLWEELLREEQKKQRMAAAAVVGFAELQPWQIHFQQIV